MTTRSFFAIAIVLLSNCVAFAELRDATIVEGNQIEVNMTGDLAKEYAKATGVERDIKRIDGLTISTIATVEQRLPDGRIRIEHSSQVKQAGKPARLVTLTATIPAA